MMKPWSAISHSGYGHLLSTWIVVLMGAMRFLEEDCVGGLLHFFDSMDTFVSTWALDARNLGERILQLEPHSHSLRSADGWNS